MSGSKSRRKGHNFERWVANQLFDAGYDARRNLEEVRSGNCGDIVVDAPLTIQCKCYAKQVPWRAAVREAEAAAPSHHYALAITRVNNDEAYVHMRWSDFKELLTMLRKEGVL